MLYFLLDWLEKTYEPPGFQMFGFITVRAALAAFTALVISMIIGKRIIRWLQEHQFKEQVRTGKVAGVVDHSHKAGTPTMGGLIILLALLTGTLLWGDLTNIYVQLIVLATVWMGLFGFADDYIKVVKKDKRGLASRTKLMGQVSLGLAVGTVLYIHPQFADVRTLTDIPFVKDRVLDYNFLAYWMQGVDLGWLIYIPVVIFIVTALSNAVNLTDGLDGLASGVSAIVTLGLVALCYVSGNAIFADFLNVMYLPGSGELTVFAAAMAAAALGFLWYNGYPAEVFMGDTGSLALGAAIGTISIMIKKELLLPFLCSVFFAETLSVIIQTTYFKYTRRKYGEGRRVFRMAPLHHHFEALGIPESKIVIRFWIVTALMVITTLLSLRIR